MWGILEYFFVVLLILIEILYCNSNISRFVCIVVSQVTEDCFYFTLAHCTKRMHVKLNR